MKDYSLLKKKIKLIDASAVSLEEHMTELFENGYDQGCVDGQKEKLANAVIYDHEVAEKTAYERGLNESWECARKIAQTMKRDEITTCFGERDEIGRKMIFEEYSASEAIAKIKEYEDIPECFRGQDAEIKVGDEVIVQEDRIGFVTGYDVFLDRVYVTTKDGWSDAFGRSFVKKTGRHFDAIPEVLKQMNREEDK